MDDDDKLNPQGTEDPGPQDAPKPTSGSAPETGDDGGPQPDEKPGKGRARQKSTRPMYCYKCGGEVSEFDAGCPHCGATGEGSPKWLLRVAIGFILGFFLWLIFWR